ncbi:MAG: ComF family protein [Chloroflexi bacterium]|nr:MAG: ComF family protein [Chloroflexota bacterium]MBL1195548.1 ComF family protein [Chloroflexota bacterium]
MRSWAIFDGPLRKAIHQLKYKRDLALGEILALPLGQILQTEEWPIDLVLSVPLSQKRLASRGYNQANLLARPLALRLSLRYAPGALKRVRETATQIGLSPPERHRNVTNAFDADLRIVSNSNVLVVDDVITTGATMQACTQSLLDAGAKQVFAISVARAGNTGLL